MKRSDKEIEKWRTQWPGIVSRNVTGDDAVATAFNGEAKSLMYEVKNAVKVGNLNQLSRTRRYPDGTVIRAVSVFGRDSIFIDTTKSIYAGGACECEIELLDVPSIVQPMRYPEIIGQGGYVEGRGWVPLEVEGTDYIKTYYRLKRQGFCPNSPLDFTVCDTGELGEDVGYKSGGTLCNPFKYTTPDAPYFHGRTTTQGIVIADNPENHCIYSAWAHCEGEILGYGQDEGGTFFIWKAYTEWSNMGWQMVNFSRTGLGYMKLRAFIKDQKGKEICHSDDYIVQVDCCHKAEELRTVTLFWEAIPGTSHCLNQPFFYYGTLQLCDTPEEYSVPWLLRDYIISYVGWWVLPELRGNCLPVEWKLDGPGRLVVWDDTSGAEWFPPDNNVDAVGCFEQIVVKATDRCGTTDKMTAISCCAANPTMSISYTSLVMGCGETQYLTAAGGCFPVTWSVDHGTIASSGSNTAAYTSEATNPNCAHNPTITARDCCGKTASVKFAVSCGIAGTSISNGYGGPCGINWWVPASSTCYGYHDFFCAEYDCEGDLISITETNPGCAAYQVVTNCSLTPPTNSSECDSYFLDTVNCAGCGGMDAATHGWKDRRTSIQKANGCCPLNPVTGLPYD